MTKRGDPQSTLFRADFEPETVAPLHGKASRAQEFVSSIWTFPGGGGDQAYRWYGTLPRALPERLLELYGSIGTRTFLDPFMGTGASLLAAAAAGLSATGMDVNPLSCLIVANRCNPAKKNDLLKEATRITGTLRLGPRTRGAVAELMLTEPRYAYTRKWFREDTLTAVSRLFEQVASIDDEPTQRMAFILAARTVREVASVDPRCTHHLVTKKKPFIEPSDVWSREIDRAELPPPREATEKAVRVVQGSVLESLPLEPSPSLVLIHPPYLGVIHYHLIHRLATDLLGATKEATNPASLAQYDFDYDHLRARDVSTDKTDTYLSFVDKLAVRMRETVSDDGRCVVVIGDQRDKGRIRHPFTDFIRAFEGEGFGLEEVFIWVLQNNGGMHVLRRGHFIDHNYVLVLRKEAK